MTREELVCGNSPVNRFFFYVLRYVLLHAAAAR